MAKDIREKENKKAEKAAKKQARRTQYSQMWQAFKLQKQRDKALVPWMIVAFLAPIILLGLLSLVWGYWFLNIPVGIVLGAMLALVVFNRRLQKGVYDQIEGEAGAAAWALQNMRDGVGMKWITEAGVASNTHMDAVHRVVGTPGIVLVGEGAPHRLKPMMAQERKKLARIVGATPIYDVVVGNEEGQVPVKKLQRHLMRMPRNVKKNEVDALNGRVESISRLTNAQRGIPKGPLPKGGQISGMGRRARRAAERGKKK
ncbi:DUF4191 domain-containing protein [Corynebacterium sp. 320]|uniref:DUF4191 domain-containing protein n=1 Tax=Corynebacterium zhongnanshanii TaxID=2768834 RepID=A0ABQ6VD39_9CORY|nr:MULTISPECIES: DUF4191 domain-containing protein [Corynebacterium]KAB1502463.1 DUF4191 domain-containing protein [Corynebacterium sp. 320]KAB1551316.1 DUF4191 domain-containing protein [Corynebacterium sp. 321]KAB1551856.1 DUF4191 domain-containing protein [Corynebacterium sp. 319]KAB3520855.1 DUF4191 domain-containing protein [Corynebacterium zhongnanshanii]KAB3526070.1 DUF4191 domain-containing protein [Corynebacterium sp. 250]